MMFYITTATIIYFLIGLVFLIATLFELIRDYERKEDVQFDKRTKTTLKVSFFLWPYALYITVAQSVINATMDLIWKLSHRENNQRKETNHGSRIKTVFILRRRSRD